MKKMSIAIVLLLAISCIWSWTMKAGKEKSKMKFKVTGTIMQTKSYCGGAAPTREMLMEAKTPAGIPFGKLFIKKTVTNEERAPIIYRIKADVDGNFSIHLPPGNYCLIEEWKTKPFILPLDNKNQTVDRACYKKLYDNCDYQFSVTDKNLDDLKFIFHRPCYYNLPCILYKGPLPHVAARH